MNCSKFYINGVTFYFSYDILIMVDVSTEHPSKIYLNRRFYDYSRTTAKHRNHFLGVDSKEFKKRLAAGEYTIVDKLDSCIEFKFNDRFNANIVINE